MLTRVRAPIPELLGVMNLTFHFSEVESALSVKAKLVEDENRNGSVKGATKWLQAAIEIQHTQFVSPFLNSSTAN